MPPTTRSSASSIPIERRRRFDATEVPSPLNGRAVLDEALDSPKRGRVLESWPFDYARTGPISTAICLHFPWRNRKKLSVERVM